MSCSVEMAIFSLLELILTFSRIIVHPPHYTPLLNNMSK